MVSYGHCDQQYNVQMQLDPRLLSPYQRYAYHVCHTPRIYREANEYFLDNRHVSDTLEWPVRYIKRLQQCHQITQYTFLMR